MTDREGPGQDDNQRYQASELAHTTNLDDFSPKRVAERVEHFGIAKTRSRWSQSFTLGALAGGFVALGGLFFTFATIDDSVWNYLAGGVVLATGYIIAILVGAEVFTSNNLLIMAWVARKLTTRNVLGNWGIVLCANALGALVLSALFLISGLPEAHQAAVGERAVELAAEKSARPALEAFALGILGNLFVCLAVWVALAGRTVTDKIVGTVLPLSAIGAMDLDHVVAILYFIPRGLLVELFLPHLAEGAETISLTGGVVNLGAVIAGNIIGGSLVVALSYHLIYKRPAEE
ncbi:formate/nitrite transporter family protein [Haloechinothrix sp. LS1_15]|uniref:formate/nitrite transporter family protein n=1 Tax=Haloechinothrix sp. LS1_15 TaxID=2652248 RepID=UPI0029458BA2|nr:formate/nitrite transporter family protein [Haloechinothrix sp. LS1_15]MDV6011320.1 formate/nitrite transporter family protein [Haloechinothrix sp. LS1_15]